MKRKPINYNVSAYQYRILLALAKAPAPSKRAFKWDLRPVRGLWYRSLVGIDPGMTFHITNLGLRVLMFQSDVPKTKLHEKKISFSDIVMGRLAT
jgi:hypothetical protein